MYDYAHIIKDIFLPVRGMHITSLPVRIVERKKWPPYDVHFIPSWKKISTQIIFIPCLSSPSPSLATHYSMLIDNWLNSETQSNNRNCIMPHEVTQLADVLSGAPNENIVQNHLDIAILKGTSTLTTE